MPSHRQTCRQSTNTHEIKVSVSQKKKKKEKEILFLSKIAPLCKEPCRLKSKASKMAQRVRAFAHQSEDSSWIPGTHRLKERTTSEGC